MNRVFKLDGTVSQSLKNYFDYVFASKNLFKSLLKLEENLDDDLKKAVKLFQENLSKLKDLKLISPETLEKTLKLIKELKLVRKSDSVKFEWLDSSLVKAIENGDWVLIDNANFCAASVLDRLNPLLEILSNFRFYHLHILLILLIIGTTIAIFFDIQILTAFYLLL